MKTKPSQLKPFRAGYIAIIGKPNVGKSTLMNHLLEEKLAIVSPRPQTTRNRILGILNGDGYQAIFLDTPGLMEPKYLLQQSLTKTSMSTMEQADLILFLIDATNISVEDDKIIDILKTKHALKFLIINKIDLVKRERILPIIQTFQAYKIFKEIIPISALKADGLELLLSLSTASLPESEPFYPADIFTDEPERFFVSEIIREKIFLFYGEEIPYATAVQINTFQEKPGEKDYIRAIIHVERDSQKGILIGKKGQAIKKVGQTARKDIEQFLGRPVFLELDVQVKKKWRKNPVLIKRLGY
ncbi:GTPase Era [bacterium]